MADTGDAGTVFGSIMTEASAARGGGEDECEDVGEGDSEWMPIVTSADRVVWFTVVYYVR